MNPGLAPAARSSSTLAHPATLTVWSTKARSARGGLGDRAGKAMTAEMAVLSDAGFVLQEESIISPFPILVARRVGRGLPFDLRFRFKVSFRTFYRISSVGDMRGSSSTYPFAVEAYDSSASEVIRESLGLGRSRRDPGTAFAFTRLLSGLHRMNTTENDAAFELQCMAQVQLRQDVSVLARARHH